MENIKSALRRLDMSESEQLVFLTLVSEGQSTARLLASRTGITRPSVYDQIKSLKKKGLVYELDIEGKATYTAAELEQLDRLLEDKIDRIEQSRDFLQKAIPTLSENMETIQPRVRFFYGEEGVKQLVKDMLWYDKLDMIVMWPHQEMLEVFGEKFLGWFHDRLALRKNNVRVLTNKKSLREAKEIFSALGIDTKFKAVAKDSFSKMGYIVYKNKTILISSNTEAFGFIVDSKQFADLMRMQFEVMWK